MVNVSWNRYQYLIQLSAGLFLTGILGICLSGTAVTAHDPSDLYDENRSQELNNSLAGMNISIAEPSSDIPGGVPFLSQPSTPLSYAKQEETSLSPQGLAISGMNTMSGSVILAPVTPTPIEMGYSYYNPTGVDPSYLIFSPGAYTLGTGFTTVNESAIVINASGVTLDGNGQAMTGNSTGFGFGVFVLPERSDAIITNFSQISNFEVGTYLPGNSTISSCMIYNCGWGIYPLQINATNITVTGNTIHHTTLAIAPFNNSNISDNNISDNLFGIYNLEEEHANHWITDNIFFNNIWASIFIEGSNYRIAGNTINKGEYGVFSWGDNTNLSGNNVSNITELAFMVRGINGTLSGNKISNNYMGIESEIDDAVLSENLVFNSSIGIIISGKNNSLKRNNISYNDLGTIFHSSDNMIIDNILSYNNYNIIIYGNNNTIYSNNLSYSNISGIRVMGSNHTITHNTLHNISGNSIEMSDSHTGTKITSNSISNNAGHGIGIYGGGGVGYGTIYNNYFSCANLITGDGNASVFSWTNPAGPEPGTSITGGPYIAGNYWSNPEKTGWSDQQPSTVTGFSTTPYMVASGAKDTLPLVKTAYAINSTADEWTVSYPGGNRTYPEGANQTYITQPKPGSILTDVKVDLESRGPIANWTFTNITAHHTISSEGNATPGQVHAIFSASPVYGPAPLEVFFVDMSLGDPTGWNWQFGDGQNATIRTPSHTYVSPGSYTVTLQATNAQSGGTGEWYHAITVTDGIVPEPTQTGVPGTLVPAYTALPMNGTVPLNVQFQDLSSGNPTEWTWDYGDGQISHEQNPQHWYGSPGTYTVTLQVRNDLSSGSLQKPGLIRVG
jgi:PKD repeat protein